jgi:hypothetical protein
MSVAIKLAARFEPVRTIIVSDGDPQDRGATKAAIRRLTGIIDVVYCGPEQNTDAREFLRSLARSVGGQYVEAGDQLAPTKQLRSVIAGLLGPGRR